MFSGKISYSKQSVIYIYNLDHQTIVTFDNTPLMRASAWHPDGVRLAYGVDTVYCLDTQTGEVEQISSDESRASYPAWHPAGQSLLYTVVDEAGLSQLCLHNITTQNKINLLLGLPALQPDWRPDGNTIAFVGIHEGQKHICKVDVSCLEIGNCAEAVQQLTTTGRFNHVPAWSPNGEWIAFEHYDEQAKNWVILLMDENGQNVRRLTEPTMNGHHPTWSRDGQFIAFERENKDAPSDLCVIKADGSDFTVLQTDGGLEPAWY